MDDAPTPLPNPDFSDLIKCIEFGTKRSIEDGYQDEDFPNYVYEAAMQAVYGKDYFTWRNSRKW